MINSNELRLGNWVHSKIKGCTRIKGGDVQLLEEQLYYLFDVDDDWERIDPIPLTGEWLIKCGYTDTNEEYLTGTLWRKGDDVHLPILIDKRGVVGILIYGAFKYLELGISVHQLQNLYFALTGDEVL